MLTSCQLGGDKSAKSSGADTSAAGSAASGAASSGAADRSQRAASTTTTTTPKRLVSADPPRDATGVAPDHVVSIHAEDAQIQAVTVTSPVGTVDGNVSPEGNEWTSTSGLVPATTYAVRVTLARGTKTSEDAWSFSTAATKIFRATIRPGDNATVGVGMPVTVTLNAPVAPANRAAFEQRLVVTANPPVVGAWHWFTATELHWRPETYWAPHTQISVAANIAGYNAGNGAFAKANVSVHYSVGDSHLSLVDAAKHQMAVITNGTLVKAIKVSTGSAKYPTHSGIHVVTEKKPTVTMDSATVGIPRNSPDGYFETVKWDVRISNSGEFVHAAPWSTSHQGNSNVSHGCVNVSNADGEWFYNYSQVGDVVQVIGTNLLLTPTNGIGDWQIPWAEWAN